MLNYSLRQSSVITSLFQYCVLSLVYSLWTHRKGGASGTMIYFTGMTWKGTVSDYLWSDFQVRDLFVCAHFFMRMVFSGMEAHISLTFSTIHAKKHQANQPCFLAMKYWEATHKTYQSLRAHANHDPDISFPGIIPTDKKKNLSLMENPKTVFFMAFWHFGKNILHFYFMLPPFLTLVATALSHLSLKLNSSLKLS